MKVAICIITCQRPEGLRALLESLNRLTFTRHHPDVEVVVVDNDTQGVASRVCDDIRPDFHWQLRCDVEPRRGIPFARNKAVASALPGADFIGFVDDDETVEPNWLDELLQVQREYGADVVTGPSVPRFVENVPQWIITGNFFQPRRYPTGHQLEQSYTNNILVHAKVFREMDRHFSDRMALTGGSDTHFFQRVHGAGYKIVWANDALAHESIPKSRVKVQWILQRNFRYGNQITLRRRDLDPSPPTLVGLFVEGCHRILQGMFLFPVGLVAGRHILMNSGRRFACGIGILFGLIGGQYEEYRRAHGE